MTNGNNAKASEVDRLPVGLIADADDARRYADAIRACPSLALRAQAGASQSAALPDVEWFDDTRVMMAQSQIRALVIATAPRSAIELSDTAADHGLHVWRSPPLGRNFAEGVEAARRLAEVKVVCRIASWWEHAGQAIDEVLQQANGFEPAFSEVQVSAAGPAVHAWRASQANAGGGVLAYDAYPMLEALIAIRGLPESAAGAAGQCRRPPSQPPRETEDVAGAILQYEGRGLAIVRAAWDIQPFAQTTWHHGRQMSMRYTEADVTVLDADGQSRAERPLPGGFLAAEMTRFAQAIGDEGQHRADETAINRHLAVSALVEATYLSSRTQQPEIPRRLFEVQKWPEPHG
jgi:predicted dehydrogenase